MALIETKKVVVDDDNFFCSNNVAADFVICKSPEKLMHLLNVIKKNNNVHYISNGDWSMHDLVCQLLHCYAPAELFITTYALREFPVRQLLFAMERKELIGVTMLLDYRAKARTPEVYQLASMNLNKIFLTSIHAKVCVLRSEKGFVSIIGSANWTQNPRIEAGVISTEPHIAKFHIEWIEKAANNGQIFE